MLQSFTSNFDNTTGNFKITLKFFGYKYKVMSYVNWGAMMAVPHMYSNVVSTVQSSTNTPEGSNLDAVSSKPVTRGFQKMKELYSEYKAKGLIDDDFPEITITQLKARLDRFIKNILDKFTKENLGVLTELDNFQTQLTEFQKKVFFYGDSWFETFMDKTNSYTIKDTNDVVYIFKKEYDRLVDDSPLIPDDVIDMFENKFKSHDNFKDIQKPNILNVFKPIKVNHLEEIIDDDKPCEEDTIKNIQNRFKEINGRLPTDTELQNIIENNSYMSNQLI
jgi:hypothetical protein